MSGEIAVEGGMTKATDSCCCCSATTTLDFFCAVVFFSFDAVVVGAVVFDVVEAGTKNSRIMDWAMKSFKVIGSADVEDDEIPSIPAPFLELTIASNPPPAELAEFLP